MIGLSRKGATIAVMVVAPVKIPAAPRPAIARPTMKDDEDGAAPHIADPISKISSARRKTHFTLKARKNFT